MVDNVTKTSEILFLTLVLPFMTLLFLYIFVAIAFSFLCSIWEAVLLSITPSFINRKVQDKSTSLGHDLRAFKKDIDHMAKLQALEVL